MLRREQWIALAVAALSRVNALLVLGFGALRVMDGYLSVGGLVAFQSLMASFIAPIESLAQFGASLQQLRGNVERLEDVQSHAQDAEVLGKNGAESVSRQLSGELALRGLTFGVFTQELGVILTRHVDCFELLIDIGDDRATVRVQDARAWRPDPDARLDLVFADPPFALLDPLPHELGAPGALAAGGLVVIETPAERLGPLRVPGLSLLRRRVYGRSAVCVYVARESTPGA